MSTRRPSFVFHPQVEVLEDRLPPGDMLHLGLALPQAAAMAPPLKRGTRPTTGTPSPRPAAAPRQTVLLDRPPVVAKLSLLRAPRPVAAPPVTQIAPPKSFTLDDLSSVAPARPAVLPALPSMPAKITFGSPAMIPGNGQGRLTIPPLPPLLLDQGDDGNYGTLSKSGGDVGFPPGEPPVDNGQSFVLKEGQTKQFIFRTNLLNPHYAHARVDWGDGVQETFDLEFHGYLWAAPYLALSHGWGDNGEFDVNISWWNDAGQSGGTSIHVTVLNVAPDVGVWFPGVINSDTMIMGENRVGLTR